MFLILEDNNFSLGVYTHGLTLRSHVDVEPAREGFRCLYKQSVAVSDDPADIIR